MVSPSRRGERGLSYQIFWCPNYPFVRGTRPVGGILHNPAYMGTAAFGKTRQGPLRPRLRAQRGRLLQPRRATSPVEVPREQWMMIPVPAIVEAEVFAAVQEQLRDNQRHARQYRRGAKYLL